MSTTSKKVYISPSVCYAFIDRLDPRHKQSTAYFRYFAQNNYQLFMDVIDISETYGKICKRMSPSVGKDFLRVLFLSDINIIYPEESEIKTALKTLMNYGNEELRYSEALRSSIASRRNISSVATFEFLHPLFGLETFFLPI